MSHAAATSDTRTPRNVAQRRCALAVCSALGSRLRETREGLRITLPTLAKLSGVSKGNLSKIEHGGNVTVTTLYRVCWSLGVHPSEMLPPGWPNIEGQPRPSNSGNLST